MNNPSLCWRCARVVNCKRHECQTKQKPSDLYEGVFVIDSCDHFTDGIGKYVTIAEIAEMLGMCERSLYRKLSGKSNEKAEQILSQATGRKIKCDADAQRRRFFLMN